MAHSLEEQIEEGKKKELVSLKKYIIELIDSHINQCDTDIKLAQERIPYGDDGDRPG